MHNILGIIICDGRGYIYLYQEFPAVFNYLFSHVYLFLVNVILNYNRKQKDNCMQASNKQINSSYDESTHQIAIFDQDYWNDQKNHAISTEKTLADVSNQCVDNSIVFKIDKEIQKTKDNFYKAENLKKIQPLDRETKFNNVHNILKEGYMQKKTDGFFFTWHERYMVLTPEKLYSFQDEKKEKVIGCVNLKILPVILKKVQQGLILDFNGQCQNLLLKASSRDIETEWQIILTQVLQFQSKQNKLLLKTMNKFTYGHQDTLSERQFLKTVQTGDILLFHTDNFGAKVQRFFTNSDYDHVAMIVKLKKRQLMVFQSNQMQGVSIYDWKQYVTYFDLYEKITVRKLHYIRKTEAQTTLLQFMKKNLGKKYQLGAAKLLQFQSDFNWENVKQDRGYFCSELIGKALKSVGLLDEKKSSGRYWPVDFSQKSDLKLKKGAYFGAEQAIILNKHTKNQL